MYVGKLVTNNSGRRNIGETYSVHTGERSINCLLYLPPNSYVCQIINMQLRHADNSYAESFYALHCDLLDCSPLVLSS
jgi:hypothetical protein